MTRESGLAEILYPVGLPQRPGADAGQSGDGSGVRAEADFDQIFLRAEERRRDMERALREPARVVITLGGPARPAAAPGPAIEVAAPYRSPLRTAGVAAASYAGPVRGARAAIIDIEI